MIKLGICNETFKDENKFWPLRKVMEYISRVGYQGIEIAPFTLAPSVEDISSAKREEIRLLSHDYGLEVIGLHWLLASPSGLSISSSDREVRHRTINYLKKLIDFCSDIGGKILVFGSPKQRSIEKNSSYEETRKRAKEVFISSLDKAEERGVIICLEPLARRETDFINTAEEAVFLIKEINHPNFKLHLDVKAVSDGKKSIPEIIKKNKDYLFHFHANDANGLGPGFGETDFEPIIKVLKEIKYSGFISVEVFDISPGQKKIAEESLAYLKKVLQKEKACREGKY